MKKTIFILFNSVILHNLGCYSQSPVGYYFDVNGMPMEGYYDYLDYSPKKGLRITYNSTSFERGHYYDSQGAKNEGLVKYKNKKLWYKKSNEGKDMKLMPEEVQGVKIGIDSFFTTTNFFVEKLAIEPLFRTKPEFMQHITSFGDLVFAKHYNFSSRLAQSYGYADPIIETYQVRKSNNMDWVSFPRREKEFREKALEYFGYLPYLENKINEEKLTSKDIMTLIKMSEYLYKYENQQPIYFDKYWQEVSEDDPYEFHAKIINKQDSIWTLDYFKGNTKLSTAQFSSFYPYLRNGDLISYYDNGQIRKKSHFLNDDLEESTIYYPSGKVHYEYEHLEFEPNKNWQEMEDEEKLSLKLLSPKSYNNQYVKEKLSYIKYKTVCDEIGKDLTRNNENFIEVYYDSISGSNQYNEFSEGILVTSYRMVNGNKVYQNSNPINKFKIKLIQNSLSDFLSDVSFDFAVQSNAQGTLFLLLTIDEKGFIADFEFLNELHSQFDGAVLQFLKKQYIKLKPYKIGREKYEIQVLVPVIFNIKRFYRPPVNYNYNYMWHDQMMLQNQMMQNDIMQNAPIPSFH